MKIGVLSIQGAVSEHLSHIARCDVEAVPVKTKEILCEVSGLVIPGGESTTIGKLIEISGLAAPIRERAHSGTLALFGTCAGLVLLAQEVLDGTKNQPKLELMNTRVKRNAFGRQRESFETKLEVKGFTSPLVGVFIRAPIIVEAGEDVEELARLPEGIVAARQGNLLAVSFHPELTDDRRMHQLFVEMCKVI